MTSRTVTFHGGTRTAVGFVVAFALALIGLVPVKAAIADSPAVVQLAFELAKFGLLAGIAAVALRREGVRIAELGLSSRHVRPALVTFGSAWAALNLLGVGLAAATGNPWGLGLIRDAAPVPFEGLPAPWATAVLLQFLVVGMVEEFAFRGYFQTKVVALLGDDSRPRVAFGVLTASVVFGLAHVPGALVAGAGMRGALSLAAITAASGIAFGMLYEATRNVYFVGLLHGLGNTWPLVVDWWSWSGRALGAVLACVAVTYLAAALAYRYWALGTDLTPAVRRRESGDSVSATGGEATPTETPEVERSP